MQLQEFFNTQKDINITDIDKLDLYQRFLHKKAKKSSLKRMSFIPAKYAVYSMIFVLMLFGVYGIYFVNTNFQDYNRFAIKSNTMNTAQADYIAQVIDVKGNFSIEHDGIIAKTNNIRNGDTVLLKEWAQLVFEIASGGTQSKIIGPAKLIIQQTHNENYKLNLVYGNYIQMEGNEWKKQTIEVAINDIIVKQQDKSQPLNFKFVKNGEDKIFQNNGANIIVTKSNGEDKTRTISKQQVITIQENDIKIFANIDSFTKAIKEKNISQTFALTGETPTASWEENKEEVMLLSLLSIAQPTEIKEEITENISSVLMDKKEILDPIQDEKISANLSEGVYVSELKVLESAFVEWNEGAFNIVYAKVERRIQNICQSFEIPFTKMTGTPIERMQWLKTTIQKLRGNIGMEYNVPPTYIENLKNIEKSLTSIISKEYGSAATHQAATGEVDTSTK